MPKLFPKFILRKSKLTRSQPPLHEACTVSTVIVVVVIVVVGIIVVVVAAIVIVHSRGSPRRRNRQVDDQEEDNQRCNDVHSDRGPSEGASGLVGGLDVSKATEPNTADTEPTNGEDDDSGHHILISISLAHIDTSEDRRSGSGGGGSLCGVSNRSRLTGVSNGSGLTIGSRRAIRSGGTVRSRGSIRRRLLLLLWVVGWGAHCDLVQQKENSE